MAFGATNAQELVVSIVGAAALRLRKAQLGCRGERLARVQSPAEVAHLWFGDRADERGLAAPGHDHVHGSRLVY